MQVLGQMMGLPLQEDSAGIIEPDQKSLSDYL
jgi:hypothetical protein